VPFKTAKILIPPNQEVRDVEVTPEVKTCLGRLYIQPGQEPVRIDDGESGGPTPPDPSVYGSEKPYPHRAFSTTGIQWKRGYQILVLNLFPMQYIPKSMEVSYFDRCRVVVTTKAAERQEGHLYRGLPRDAQVVKEIVDNESSIAMYGGQPSGDQLAYAFQYPVDAYAVNGYYFGENVPKPDCPQRYHLGEDVCRPAGTQVYTCSGGIVRLANSAHEGYGGLIVVEHTVWDGTQYCSLYGHLDSTSIAVEVGEAVKRGQRIGEVSGNPEDHNYTVPHLHFAIRCGSYVGENALDPNTTSGWLRWTQEFGQRAKVGSALE
jgi:murein DD-endopeptidase MepM/ murein hydrolase activator NlpD